MRHPDVNLHFGHTHDVEKDSREYGVTRDGTGWRTIVEIRLDLSTDIDLSVD